MTYTRNTIQDFLSSVQPFDQVSAGTLKQLSEKFQLLRYRMGQAILLRDKLPGQVAILYQGQARLLGYDPRTEKPITLQLLQPGAVLGWLGLVRGVPCETAIASTETICLVIPAIDFLTAIEAEPSLAAAFREKCPLLELFDLIGEEIHRQAIGEADIKQMALQAQADAIVKTLPQGTTRYSQLDPQKAWFVSG